MDRINFVQIKDDELVGVVALLAGAIWREHYPSIIGEAQVSYMIEKFQSAKAISAQIQDDYRYYLIRDNEGQYIGYLGVRIENDGLFLSKIYLKSAVRGRGLGRQTLNFIDGLARENGCLKIWLTVNKKNSGAVKVYQRCGFRIAGSIVQDIGGGFVMDDYQMEKML